MKKTLTWQSMGGGGITPCSSLMADRLKHLGGARHKAPALGGKISAPRRVLSDYVLEPSTMERPPCIAAEETGELPIRWGNAGRVAGRGAISR